MKSAEEILRMRMLFQQGWSKRRIAAELGISRNTIKRYLSTNQSPSIRTDRSKKKQDICLEWLNRQRLTGDEDKLILWQRLQEEMQIKVSQRTFLHAIKAWKSASDQCPQPLSSHEPVHTEWCIGPYRFTAAGTLTLREMRIEIPRAQSTLLSLFVRHPNRLISYDEIANHLWPQQKPSPHWRRNISLTIHRLRQVFAMGPLGGQIFRSVYQCGYVLNADVEASHPASLQRQLLHQQFSVMLKENPFYCN